MDHKNVKYVVGGGNYDSQVVELVDTEFSVTDIDR